MRRGFTLIELLAVILILGIIALIAIPTINKLLDESRRGAFKETLNQVNKAVENKCTLEQIKNLEPTTHYTITNGVISPEIEIKGELPDGEIIVDSDCGVTFNLANTNFIGTKDTPNGDIEIVKNNQKNKVYKEYKTGTKDEVSIIYYNVTTKSFCNESEFSDKLLYRNVDMNKCQKWFAVENSGKSKSTVDAILYRNINDYGYPYSSSSNKSNDLLIQKTKELSSSWGDGLNVRNLTLQEVFKITDYNEFNPDEVTSDLNLNYYYFENKEKEPPTYFEGQLGKYYWLYDHTYNCMSSKCTDNDSNLYGYWLNTPLKFTEHDFWAYGIDGGYLGIWDVLFDDYFGIRPVITITK